MGKQSGVGIWETHNTYLPRPSALFPSFPTPHASRVPRFAAPPRLFLKAFHSPNEARRLPWNLPRESWTASLLFLSAELRVREARFPSSLPFPSAELRVLSARFPSSLRFPSEERRVPFAPFPFPNPSPAPAGWFLSAAFPSPQVSPPHAASSPPVFPPEPWRTHGERFLFRGFVPGKVNLFPGPNLPSPAPFPPRAPPGSCSAPAGAPRVANVSRCHVPVPTNASRCPVPQ